MEKCPRRTLNALKKACKWVLPEISVYIYISIYIHTYIYAYICVYIYENDLYILLEIFLLVLSVKWTFHPNVIYSKVLIRTYSRFFYTWHLRACMLQSVCK